jgi:stage IV sporulation protein FB
MRSPGGYLVLGRWGGAPVRVHWTLPLGALFFSQLRFVPGFWLGFFLLTLVHELGHAVVVRRQRCRVISIDVHGLGGACQWSGPATPIGRACIAWGGVMAQLVALGFTGVVLVVLGPPPTAFAAQLAGAMIGTNVFIILINLIPVPPLDGAEAWKLPGLLWRRRRRRIRNAGQRAAARELNAVVTSDGTSDGGPIRPEVKAGVDAFFRRLADEKEREPRE